MKKSEIRPAKTAARCMADVPVYLFEKGRMGLRFCGFPRASVDEARWR